MKVFFSFLLFFSLLVASVSARAAVNVPFSIGLSEPVLVTGSPRIVLDVGGVTRYAVYSSGSGSSTLTFVYSVQSGDVDMDGISIQSPIQLNGGAISDLSGNAAALTFTPPDTSGVKINAAVPSGYSVAFSFPTVTNQNKTAMAFVLNGGKTGRTYSYSISSSGGGSPVVGSGAVTSDPQTVSGINVSALPDGKLTLSLTLTDSLGGVGAAVTAVAAKAVLDSNLVGHWTFDSADITGAIAYDRSGQNNNLTLYNGPALTSGQIGGALTYDGVNDYGSAPNAASLNITDTITLCFWIKANASFVGYASHPIAKWTTTTNANYVIYYFGTTSGVDRRIAFYANKGGTWMTVAPSYLLPLNVWKHFVYTYNSASGGSLYIDGALVGTSPGTGVLATNTSSLMLPDQGYFPGLMDDVRIYNRVLSLSEVQAIYNSEH